MEDFFDLDKIKAFVYLLSEGDDGNKSMISDDHIRIIRSGKKNQFSLNSINSIIIESKKMLFPLIVGGIVTPFAFLSYFVNLFHPWLHLVSSLGGMLLLYIGWTGKSALTVNFKNGETTHIYLPSVSKNLQAFIDFSNDLLNTNKYSDARSLLFFRIDHKTIYPLFGYTYGQFNSEKDKLKIEDITAIDPQKVGVEIKFEYDHSVNQMRPILTGPVSKAAIVEYSRTK